MAHNVNISLLSEVHMELLSLEVIERFSIAYTHVKNTYVFLVPAINLDTYFC